MISGGLKIGRILGINIAVDWSWVLVFALMSSNLTAVFATWHPHWSLGTAALLAISAALLFFVSVLAHELAHAAVARSYGMVVREIRLFLFGGVSNIEHEPPSPGAELKIAIAGPLVSIGLGIALIAAATFLLPPVDPFDPALSLASLGPIGTLFFWLGPINLTVGLFNLIPGFPLDGGRILRAVIWWTTWDLRRATLIATSVGRATGLAFVLAGIAIILGARIPFLGQGAGAGVWVAFIGWFLKGAAERSYGALVVDEMLAGIRADRLMRRHGPVLPPNVSVRSAIDGWFTGSSESALPIADDGHFLGLLSVRDVRKAPPSSWDITRVTEVMTPRDELAVIPPQLEVTSALRKLGELGVEYLPVVEDDKLVGMLSRADVERWLELRAPAEGDVARPRFRRV